MVDSKTACRVTVQLALVLSSRSLRHNSDPKDLYAPRTPNHSHPFSVEIFSGRPRSPPTRMLSKGPSEVCGVCSTQEFTLRTLTCASLTIGARRKGKGVRAAASLGARMIIIITVLITTKYSVPVRCWQGWRASCMGDRDSLASGGSRESVVT
jgi:hypothetical protein